MSFLLDPPLLIASGIAIEKVLPEDQRDQAEMAVDTVFLGISTLLYTKAPVPGLGLFWKPFRSANSRDFMLNSGVFHFRYESPGWRTHTAAIATFATYPLWLKLGRRIGQRLVASKAPVAATANGNGASNGNGNGILPAGTAPLRVTGAAASGAAAASAN